MKNNGFFDFLKSFQQTLKKGSLTAIYFISKFSIFRKLPLLLSLTRRGLLFFFFLLIAQILLFFTGNIQNFLDENLELILFMCTCTSIGIIFFALAAVIETICYIKKERKNFYYVHLLFFIIFLIAGLFVCLLTNSIEALSDGLTQTLDA